MAENSRIPWCDHTWNCWRGCVKISPGCAHCYAEAGSKRNPTILGVWGADGKRVAAAEKAWVAPVRWNEMAAAAGERKRVFSLSLGDWLEDWGGPVHDVRGHRLFRDKSHRWYPDDFPEGLPPGAEYLTLDDVRLRMLDTIRRTPGLDWLLLTKRPENWGRVLMRTIRGVRGDCDRFDETLAWATDWMIGQPPANVWVGASVEDRQRAEERIPGLLAIPARVRFLSLEPLLERIHLRSGIYSSPAEGGRYFGTTLDGIHWVIIGGESDQGGQTGRPFDLTWARWTRDQCRAAAVPFFMKQMGANPVDNSVHRDGKTTVVFRDRAGEDPDEWPEDLRIRELPAIAGKEAV